MRGEYIAVVELSAILRGGVKMIRDRFFTRRAREDRTWGVEAEQPHGAEILDGPQLEIDGARAIGWAGQAGRALEERRSAAAAVTWLRFMGSLSSASAKPKKKTIHCKKEKPVRGEEAAPTQRW